MGDPPPFATADLQAWYQAFGRHSLPWRLTRDPYRVLVSEFMLQQTQVGRVLPVYEAWMMRWPSARALADASRADVIRAWAGLGYNRRAVRLHDAAAAFSRDGGRVPLAVGALESQPGIGSYTARAVACFAGDAQVTVLDANTKRVLARARLGVEAAVAAAPRLLEEAAFAVLPPGRARDHNLALMDLGALVCRARRPSCSACPLQDGCAWRCATFPRAPRPSRPPPTRFDETSRYARGRIIAALREHDQLSSEAIEATLPEIHRPRAGDYLAALREEGLAEHEQGRWRLAGGGPVRG